MTTRTLAELAALVGATLEGEGAREVVGPAALADASSREISFLASPRYAALLRTTRAAAVLVAREVPREREDLALLRCDDPGRAFTAIIRLFVPPETPPPPGIDASAWIAPGASVSEGAHVGPLCLVDEGAQVADGAVLVGQVHVGRGARVGASSILHPGVVLYPGVSVGERCVLHAGCIVGADGFGFDPADSGWTKVPQCGTVEIEDDVELGANCTIDRARFGATRIGRGAKLDNLVHVAHNCTVEAGALLCAQVGLAGSARIGRGAILAGQVGVNGHITIGPGARLGGQAGVFGDVPAGEDWTGWPARPRAEALRSAAFARRLPQLAGRLRALEERLARLEEGQA